MIIIDRKALKRYENGREWQGIPGIERTDGGRLFATFYSGGAGEGVGNFAALIKSEDNGETWSGFIAVADPGENKRAFDPFLFKDPLGRLWWGWNQSTGKLFDGVCGVWLARCENPDSENPSWNRPERVANGVMMNKPTFLENGDWLLPCAVWNAGLLWEELDHRGQSCERKSNVYISTDEGKSFRLHGQAEVPDRYVDEHMTVEMKDGSIEMFVRTTYGIGKSSSYDGGKTWTPGEDSGLGGPNSRFFIRRLPSGRILLINHYGFTGRNNLTAMLSEDEGATWKSRILLDGRDGVSYPDATFDNEGNIYIVYDRDRKGAGEIILAKITEKDILDGGTPGILKHVISSCG